MANGDNKVQATIPGSASASSHYPAVFHSNFKFNGSDKLKSFDGKPDSYLEWKVQVNDLARAHGIRCLVSDKVNRSSSSYTEEMLNQIDEQLLGVLYSTLTTEVRLSTCEYEDIYTTTKEFLEYMDATYQSTTSSSKYSLLLDLIGVKQNNRTISEVTNDYKIIKSKLVSLGFKLDDLYLLILLNGLDSEYDLTKQILTAMEPLPALDTAIAKLLSRESELKVSKRDGDLALRTENHKQDRQYRIQTPTKAACQNCGSKYHRAASCWHDGRDK
ncbi:hypothetical protein SeMB42_g02311 [Synchytrium endobioticum]|uniref:CCHC-type domain-containing protein n=1 Tax=Synchytrium endobioticum TaxID=286115 RepID=A0A507DH68_9FUNG|nr:hypothetical protein SeMB42_g02311 [Synchytrium endobioticum]